MDENATQQFCCYGCRTVYGIIHESGMGYFYEIRNQGKWKKLSAKTTYKDYVEYDDPLFQDRHCRQLTDGLRCSEFYLEGIHCTACIWLLEKLPRIIPGLLECRFNYSKALLRIAWDNDQVCLSEIARTLDQFGYTPHPIQDKTKEEIQTQEDRLYLIRLAVAGAASGNTMLIAVALYAGMFTGIAEQYATLFRWISMFIGWIAVAWPGSVFFRGAWAAIKTRTPHMDLPIAFGLGTGAITGTINTFAGRGDIYFDSLSVLVFLLLVGRWLQRRQQRRAQSAVSLLFSLIPTSCRLVRNDGVHEVPIEALQFNDLVEVRAGDSIPADGIVEKGSSTVDESLLTGESCPQSVSVSGAVYSGTVNLSSPMRIRVKTTGAQTRMGKLMQIVENCIESKAPFVQFADRIAGVFIIAVVVFAILTFAIWWWKDASQSVNNAVALLIVACPCALGLATPLALAVSIGHAAQRKILIKGGHVFEQLVQAGVIFLDKTGTITQGTTILVQWYGRESLKNLVRAVETHSSHPIARAFIKGLPECDLKAVDVCQRPEGGISGRVMNHQVVVGSRALMKELDIPIPDWAVNRANDYIDGSLTPVYIAVDGRIEATAGLGDAIRSDSASAINSLRCYGWKVRILSGDHPELVQRVASKLKINPEDSYGGLTPEQKLQVVQEAKQRSSVVMVGDGVNDTAAIAAANVGIAVHGGAEASLAAADVYLSSPGLNAIVELMEAAHRTVRVIRRNLLVSLSYNAVAVTMAATGLINPLIAAILMPLSSFTVLSLSIGGRTFRSKSCQ